MKNTCNSICYLIIAWVLIWLITPGAFASADSAVRTISVTDMAARQVTIPFDPERIVCIGPGALRLIVYLQAQSKLVGVEDVEKRKPDGRPYIIAHPELCKLPRCGPGGAASVNKKPDMETVIALMPQVIFITYMEADLADEVQRILGIPVVVLVYGEHATFDERVYDALRISGRILNRKKRADNVVNYIEFLKNDLQTRKALNAKKNIQAEKKQRVYVGGVSYRGAHGIESTEQNYIPFQWLGAENVARQVKPSMGTHVFMDKETLLRLNPDIIFLDSSGSALIMEDFCKKPEFYNVLKAFSNKRVYTLLPYTSYATNIGTALGDAYAIGKILYPYGFADIDPGKKADQIYTFMVGKPVYDEIKHEYKNNFPDLFQQQ